jgi:hypothetical protein
MRFGLAAALLVLSLSACAEMKKDMGSGGEIRGMVQDVDVANKMVTVDGVKMQIGGGVDPAAITVNDNYDVMYTTGKDGKKVITQMSPITRSQQ